MEAFPIMDRRNILLIHAVPVGIVSECVCTLMFIGFPLFLSFFQLVWGDTYLVGCGYSNYYDPSRGYTKLYVCNYGPG
jgi:hypothetical protein